MFFPESSPESSFEIGLGAGLNFPVQHSLWGSSIVYGGRSEVVLDPYIVTLSLPIRLTPEAGEGLVLTLAPAILLGTVSGDLQQNTERTDFSPGFGIGGAGAVSVGFFLTENLGITAEAGLRVLQADLVYMNPSSETGYSQPRLSTGEDVRVDLGGSYGLIGLTIRL